MTTHILRPRLHPHRRTGCVNFCIHETIKHLPNYSYDDFWELMSRTAKIHPYPYPHVITNSPNIQPVPWPRHLNKLYFDTSTVLEHLSQQYTPGVITNQSLGTEERLKSFAYLNTSK